MSTRHPGVPKWVGAKPRLLLLNRADMVPSGDRARWARFFRDRGQDPVWTTGNQGEGVDAVSALRPAGAAPCSGENCRRCA
jgi:ribosome biogenesis GTPase A